MSVDADLPIGLRQARSIADQPPEIDELAPGIAGGDRITCCETDQLAAPAHKQRICGDEESFGFERCHPREGSLKLALSAGRYDFESKPEPRREVVWLPKRDTRDTLTRAIGLRPADVKIPSELKGAIDILC